jgi:hypothetical protein
VHEPRVERHHRHGEVVAVLGGVGEQLAVAQVPVRRPVQVRVVEDECGAQGRRAPGSRRGQRAQEVRQGQQREAATGNEALAQELVGAQLVGHRARDLDLAAGDPARCAVERGEHVAVGRRRLRRQRRDGPVVEPRAAQGALERRAVGEVHRARSAAVAFAGDRDEARDAARGRFGDRGRLLFNADESVDVLDPRAVVGHELHGIECLERGEQPRAQGALRAGDDAHAKRPIEVCRGRSHRQRCSIDERVARRSTCGQ